MPDLTPNYGFIKPKQNENYNVNTQNENMDIIDGKLKDVETSVGNLDNDVETHLADDVSQGELHGFRLTDGKLEYFDGLEWQRVRGDGYPVGNISNFNDKSDDKQITLTWKDPDDVTITDSNDNIITIARWKGTKILRKTGSYPENENDGVLVINSSVKNQYAVDGFTDTGLVNGTEYFYMAFPYTEDDVFTVDVLNRISATPTEVKIYGVKIDTNNNNPKTAVTYTDDSIGLTPMFCNNGTWQMGSWEDKFPFNEIKPCMLKNGVVEYYLNPNDYTQKSTGGASDITSGNAGDVMVEFPRIYWKFERIGTDLHIRYSDVKVDEGYKCLAHTVGGKEKDNIYLPAYRGFSTGGKLRSLSGKTPTATQTIGAFRTLAQANGAGYQQMAYYPLLMLQVLALVAGKNRDSQTQLGRGFVDGNSAATNTGQTNKKGMFYGEGTGKFQNKFCGVEDFYGNQYLFIDGLYSDSNWNIMISDQSVFNDTGSGYVNQGKGATANTNGYIGDVQGGTETGFIIKSSDGSATTHYSDSGDLDGGSLPAFGGYWSTADIAGAFCLRVDQSASSSYAYYGAALCFLGS